MVGVLVDIETCSLDPVMFIAHWSGGEAVILVGRRSNDNGARFITTRV